MTTITATRMVSEATPHSARRVQLAPERWRVSWYPERLLDRPQAITAMMMAEEIDRRAQRLGPGPGLFEELAAELDLTGGAAAAKILREPHVLDRRLHMLSTSCWCEPAAALDGHINEDGSEPEFGATDGDPVDADGFLLEKLAR